LFFLAIFDPFGIAEITLYKHLFILGYSFITLFIVGISFFIFPFLFNNLVDDWTVKKNIYFIVVQLTSISIFNWFYTITVGKTITVNEHSAIEVAFYTISIGVFPVILFTLLVERYLDQENKLEARELTKELSEEDCEEKLINQKIIIGSKNETFSIDVNELLCAKSDGNYCELFYLKQNKLEKKIIRFSLAMPNGSINYLII